MKLNFDKIKKVATKTAIGAGVISASLGNLEAQEVKSGQKEKEINKTEVIKGKKFFEQKWNEYIKYIQHPEYRKRLKKELFGSNPINEENEKILNDIYNYRLEKIRTTPIKDLLTRRPFSNYNLNGVYHNKKGIIYTMETTNTNKRDELYGNGGSFDGTLYHELTHTAHTSDKFKCADGFFDKKDSIILNRDKFNNHKEYMSFLDNYIKEISNNKKSFWGYLQNSKEMRARLTSLRLMAIEKYNFNQNNDFDISKFPELKENIQYKDLHETLELSDEEINELMKSTADNNENSGVNDTYVHPDWDYGNEDNKA